MLGGVAVAVEFDVMDPFSVLPESYMKIKSYHSCIDDLCNNTTKAITCHAMCVLCQGVTNITSPHIATSPAPPS